MTRTVYVLLSFVVILIVAFGCSSGNSSPVTPQDISTDIPTGEMEAESRKLLGVWNLEFDAESLEAIVTPSRLANTHYQVKYLIPTPEVVINAYHPNYVVDADVTLTNPFTFDAYDIRLILFTDDESHILENPDCWTGLYDIPAGMPINPFKAYAKDEPNRVFAGGTNHTENLLVFSPPGSHPIQFAIDASFPVNCEEPYEITDFNQGVLYDEIGYSTDIEITVRDWQDDANEVKLYCPEITGGTLLTFDQIDPDKWQAEIINETGALSGEYEGYVIATSSNSGTLALYDEVAIIVNHGVFDPINPEIVASLHLMDFARTVATNGNYAYVGEGDNRADSKMKVLDISNPVHPEIIGQVDSLWSFDIFHQGDYVYLSGDKSSDSTLEIIDVSNPETPFIAGSIEIFGYPCAWSVFVKGDYAYVACGFNGLIIVDVSDPTTPAIVGEVDGMNATDVYIQGNYLYLAVVSNLMIFDISDPINPIETGVVDVYSSRLTIDGNLAFVIERTTYISIVDISDPSNPEVLSQLVAPYDAHRAVIKNNYAFVGSDEGIDVIDFSDPTQPEFVERLFTENANMIEIQNDYAYVADQMGGFLIVDITNPTDLILQGGVPIIKPSSIEVKNDIAISDNGISGCAILDISNRNDPQVLSFDLTLNPEEIIIVGNYAYFAGNKLTILDISDPTNPETISIYDPPELFHCIAIQDECIYGGTNNDYFIIVDISNPSEPELLSQIDTCTKGIAVNGDYAYVAATEEGFKVIDIHDPINPQIVGQVFTLDAVDVVTDGYYAYIADFEEGLKIVNISDPANPETIGQEFIDRPRSIVVDGDYAYMALDSGALKILNISDPSDPFVYSMIETEGATYDVKVERNYAYLADLDGGLKIIKLW
ncbi:hypothetical protein J7L05_07835 [bacterium]|nr:hypothetical protein [bacterium]